MNPLKIKNKNWICNPVWSSKPNAALALMRHDVTNKQWAQQEDDVAQITYKQVLEKILLSAVQHHVWYKFGLFPPKKSKLTSDKMRTVLLRLLFHLSATSWFWLGIPLNVNMSTQAMDKTALSQAALACHVECRRYSTRRSGHRGLSRPSRSHLTALLWTKGGASLCEAHAVSTAKDIRWPDLCSPLTRSWYLI